MSNTKGSYDFEVRSDLGHYLVVVDYDQEEQTQEIYLYHYDKPPIEYIWGFFPVENDPIASYSGDHLMVIESVLEDLIAEYEFPLYQREKMMSLKRLDIDHEYELERRREEREERRRKRQMPPVILNISQEDMSKAQKGTKKPLRISDWQHGNYTVWTGEGNYPRGHHPNSQQNLKQNQK